MLIYRRTSILESPAQTLVNTVNCVGVMGKGLAHAFKEREPKMFDAYKRICDQKSLEPGKLWLWRGSNGWVLNFPTKLHWRQSSKIEWIEQGLEKFVSAYEEQGISEISFPRLGCGNGNLDWNEVRPLMEHYLSKVDIPVYIHDFTVDVGLPEHLEPIAIALKAESPSVKSFDDFLHTLRRAFELTDGKMTMLGSNDEFEMRIDESGMVIATASSVSLFEEEDLRGVWLDLQNGLVTKRKAGWSIKDSGESLVSILSIMPSVRPVIIQRPGHAEPEFAVEPCPSARGLISAGQSISQNEFAWH